MKPRPHRRAAPAVVVLIALLAALGAAPAHAAAIRYGMVGAANLGQIEIGNVPSSLTFSIGNESSTATRVQPLAPGWEFGGVVEWPRSGWLRLESGARYVVQSDKTEVTSGGQFGSETRTETRLEYVALPIQALVSPFESRGLRLSGGLHLGYLLRAKSKLESSVSVAPAATSGVAFADIFELPPFGAWGETTSMYERWNTELSAGAGWEFGGEHPGLRFDARYAYGLPDISKGETERHTRRLSFSVATLW